MAVAVVNDASNFSISSSWVLAVIFFLQLVMLV